MLVDAPRLDARRGRRGSVINPWNPTYSCSMPVINIQCILTFTFKCIDWKHITVKAVELILTFQPDHRQIKRSPKNKLLDFNMGSEEKCL